MRLRQALRRDLGTIAEVWVEAFGSDPYLRWLGGGDDTTWPAFGQAWFRFILDLAFERGHTYLTDPVGGAVAWIPPDLTFAGPDDVARGAAIIAQHAGDSRSDAAVASILAARAHLPEDSHWTLQYVGIAPARRGGGLGAELLAPVLGRIDADELPCALVSTNQRNVAFYERHGFAAVAEVATDDGAATLRPMVRPAGGPPGP